MFTPRDLGVVFGAPNDPKAPDPASSATVVALLKAILAALPAIAPDAPVTLPVRRIRVPAEALGSPWDPRATDTTSAWSAVSLLKGILYRAQQA